MAVFTELDWRRLDVWAIVGAAGTAVVDIRQHPQSRRWLEDNGYTIGTLNCTEGLNQAIPALGRMLNWEQQFGYSLGPESRNLDALNDGFEFTVPENGGYVLDVIGADLAWEEDARWLQGFLAIAQSHSRKHLALGQRFFVLLALPQHSPLIGAVIEETRVPAAMILRQERETV